MGADLARYLEAGLQNCIDHVKVLIENPWRGELRMAAISKAEFFIPLKFSRRVEHHRDWPLYLSEYEAALKVAQEVRLKARRNFANRAMTIAQKFPGITDKMARRLAAKGSMP